MPVSLEEAKQHLRVFDGNLDTDIQGKLEAAVAYCESVTGRALRISHTLTQTYDGWPCDPIQFDREPVKSITSVGYYDENGTLQTLVNTSYRLHQSSEAAAHLEWDDSFLSPLTDSREGVIVITYVAGYASVDVVPFVAKEAVKLTLSLLFGNLDDRECANYERARDDLLATLRSGHYR